MPFCRIDCLKSQKHCESSAIHHLRLVGVKAIAICWGRLFFGSSCEFRRSAFAYRISTPTRKKREEELVGECHALSARLVLP